MNDVLSQLNSLIGDLESKGMTREATTAHRIFLKLALVPGMGVSTPAAPAMESAPAAPQQYTIEQIIEMAKTGGWQSVQALPQMQDPVFSQKVMQQAGYSLGSRK